ncbi:hypothetical protein ACQUSR_19145 [Streptomyces sp. P1-3]|uniref:hypothetical protein n=1 Tax=Streptomyces sp. P1-3 TaxID=3421658 RepID=UPI003D360079
MKIQERTGAAHGRGSQAPAQGVGERLPSAPRERKPALAALAVLLILVGALGATVLVLRAGDRIEVVKITEDVTAGKKIPESAMESVLVAEDSGIKYVKWDQRDAIAKYRATKDIVAGSLLVAPMLTSDANGLPDGKVLVGLSLKAGQYPSDLEAGDTVTAFRVSDADNKGSSNGSSGASGGSSGGSNTVLAQAVKVHKIDRSSGDIGSTDLPVSVLAEQSQAPGLVQAAAAGEVAIVKVPAAGE